MSDDIHPQQTQDERQREPELRVDRSDLNEIYKIEDRLIEAGTGDTIIFGRLSNRVIRFARQDWEAFFATNSFTYTAEIYGNEEIEEARHGGAKLIKMYEVAYSPVAQLFRYI